jgi:hypothetical protein
LFIFSLSLSLSSLFDDEKAGSATRSEIGIRRCRPRDDDDERSPPPPPPLLPSSLPLRLLLPRHSSCT